MSGYTGEARREALEQARDRAVILLNGEDVLTLATGCVHIADLVDERIDAIVRRYETN
jgi:hypothetical protein